MGDAAELKIQDLATQDRLAAIETLAAALARAEGLDTAVVTKAVREREELSPTALGNGVAAPHARLDGIPGVRAILGRSREGIPWDAPDGRPVHLVFLFVSPRIGIQLHTEVLQRIAEHARRHALDRVTVKDLQANELWELIDERDGDG